MRRLFYLGVAAASIGLASPAVAQPSEGDRAHACPSAVTTLEMTECTADAYAEADRALNRTYQEAIQSVDGATASRLRRAQRAWIRYRDLEAEAARSAYEGGSMAPLVAMATLLRLTVERTGQLEDGYLNR